MGYNSINRAEITRVFSPERKIVARVYCDELKKWETKEFSHYQLELAVAWVADRMSALSM